MCVIFLVQSVKSSVISSFLCILGSRECCPNYSIPVHSELISSQTFLVSRGYRNVT